MGVEYKIRPCRIRGPKSMCEHMRQCWAIYKTPPIACVTHILIAADFNQKTIARWLSNIRRIDLNRFGGPFLSELIDVIELLRVYSKS